jgi:hypothetical protein
MQHAYLYMTVFWTLHSALWQKLTDVSEMLIDSVVRGYDVGSKHLINVG